MLVRRTPSEIFDFSRLFVFSGAQEGIRRFGFLIEKYRIHNQSLAKIKEISKIL